MDLHQNLVNALISAFQNRGYRIIKATSPGYQQPEIIGRHEPDIIAQDPDGLLIIGVAKTENDISSQISKEQFIDFSTRIMSEGPLRGRKAPMHIIVPQNSSESLRNILASLGLNTKINESIFIWTN